MQRNNLRALHAIASRKQVELQGGGVMLSCSLDNRAHKKLQLEAVQNRHDKQNECHTD